MASVGIINVAELVPAPNAKTLLVGSGPSLILSKQPFRSLLAGLTQLAHAQLTCRPWGSKLSELSCSDADDRQER